MTHKLVDYMTRRVPVAHPGETVGQVVKGMHLGEFDHLECVFVTDDHGRLLGRIKLANLLKSDSSTAVTDLLQPCLAVNRSISLEHAANEAIRKKMHYLAVTDSDGVFDGLLPAQAILETLRREHVEDLHRIAGIRKEASSAGMAISEPPVRSVWHRLPWLMVGLVGSFMATFIMSRFEGTLNNNIALAFFIPGIVYLADAIGTQTETIVIRGLSLSRTTLRQNLAHEFFTGWLIGLILGAISLTAALLAGFGMQVSMVVGISVLVAGTLATTIGLLLPWLLYRLGKDPAFGSGPLATIIQDILSILVFLLVAIALGT